MAAGETENSAAVIGAAAAAADAETEATLSNRGNKLRGHENPGGLRPQLWSAVSSTAPPTEDDFPAVEGGFVRRARAGKGAVEGAGEGEDGLFFVRLMNGYDVHASLFTHEGISLKGMFECEDLNRRPLSLRMRRVLAARHLSVLSALLMLEVEREQTEYRRLMQLAEWLCIEEYRGGKDGGECSVLDSNGRDDSSTNKSFVLPEHVQREVDQLLNRTSGSSSSKTPASTIDSADLLQMQALGHELLHAKRCYISMLRKIRAGAVYAQCQAGHTLRRISRISRHLLRARAQKGLPERDDEDGECKENGEG